MFSTSARFMVGLAAAGVVAAGGSAYTAASTMTAVANDKVSYGSVTVSNVTITNVAYNVATGNSSLLQSIVFTASGNVSSAAGYAAVLTINGPATGGAGYERVNDCGEVHTPDSDPQQPGFTTITCNTSHTIGDIATTDLAVTTV